MKSVLAFLSILAFIFLLPAYAEKIDFGNGGSQFQYVPSNNTAPSTVTAPNYHVEIHLPQNGAMIIMGILSNGNFTHLKENIATMAVENIYTTTELPSLNYCPVAKYILDNQDGYYKRIANLTQYVLPVWCYKEVYPAVPEFPTLTSILAGAFLVGTMIFVFRWHHN